MPQGVDVVLFDRHIECNYISYVSGNNEEFGMLAGKKVLDQVKVEQPDAFWAQDDQVLLGIFDNVTENVDQYIKSRVKF